MRISKTAQKPRYFKQKIFHRISKSKNKETQKIANVNFKKWKQKLLESKITSFSNYVIFSQKMNFIYEANFIYETNFQDEPNFYLSNNIRRKIAVKSQKKIFFVELDFRIERASLDLIRFFEIFDSKPVIL